MRRRGKEGRKKKVSSGMVADALRRLKEVDLHSGSKRLALCRLCLPPKSPSNSGASILRWPDQV